MQEPKPHQKVGSGWFRNTACIEDVRLQVCFIVERYKMKKIQEGASAIDNLPQSCTGIDFPKAHNIYYVERIDKLLIIVALICSSDPPKMVKMQKMNIDKYYLGKDFKLSYPFQR